MLPVSHDLDLRSLRWSLVVARQGGFRRAAETLGVEQSAVSRRIRDLEDVLGVSLFQRGPKGAATTHAGRAFLQRIETLMAGLAQAATDAQAAGAGQTGMLRIGLSFSLISDRLFDLIKHFHGAHPGVRIQMIEGRPSEHLEAIADRRVDVAVVPGGMTVTGLDISVLWRERLLVALPADHPAAEQAAVRLEALAPARLFVSERDLGAECFANVARRRGKGVEIEIQDAGGALLLEQTRLGLGCTLLSSGALSGLRVYPDLVFRPLATDNDEALAIAAAWSSTNDNPALRRFVSSTRRRPTPSSAPKSDFEPYPTSR